MKTILSSFGIHLPDKEKKSTFAIHSRAPQFQKVCLGSEVGSNIDQNEPLRLGFSSFASKLMDRNSIKVFTFEENQSPKNWKTEMDGDRFMIPSGEVY